MEGSLISICIPCYEMGGKGAARLEQLLRSICYQTYTVFEVIISDHSLNTDILSVTKSFEFEHLNISYFKNNYKRGSSSANINHALNKANGEIIKIMFQDDYFIEKDALSIIVNRETTWGVCGCVHSKEEENIYYNRLIPYWQDRVKDGVNTLGGPSCLYFRQTDLRFDERLLWFMDTDFYYSFFSRYGPPDIIKEPLYCSRDSSISVTNTMINDKLIENETKILKEKYGI